MHIDLYLTLPEGPPATPTVTLVLKTIGNQDSVDIIGIIISNGLIKTNDICICIGTTSPAYDWTGLPEEIVLFDKRHVFSNMSVYDRAKI